jgi:hypothetical protein
VIDAILGERYVVHSWLSWLDLLYVRGDVAEMGGPPVAKPS